MLRNLKHFNLSEIEEKVLKFWRENQIFQKSLEKKRKEVPRQAPAAAKAKAGRRDEKTKFFRFFEGPPTANGRPGLHHVLARVFKDIVCRYRTMRGFFVSRRAGWDTHGLPIELEVEKKLGLKNKQEIEKFGIAEFNEQAKISVWTYKSDWEKLTERIGFWLDFENPYITYDNKYIESLWWIFGEIAKRGFLKRLYKVVPWCPRCQTPLSSHELGQPGAYRLTKDPSVYVKFKLKPSFAKASEGKRAKNEFLLVWTTTPWTLPANVAVAVNPGLTYTKYKVGDEYFWSCNPPPSPAGIRQPAEKEGKKTEIEVVEKLSGKKLIGLEYEPLYGMFDVRNDRNARLVKQAKRSSLDLRSPNIYRVIAADFVSTEEGTGLVHIAPAFGEDDLEVISKSKIQITKIPITIDDKGIVKRGLPGGGKFIKEADADIIKDLEKRGFLYSRGAVEHEYPFCWRCSAPLIYFARHSWFIEMSRLRDELIAANKKINWIPGHIKEGRFGEWLRELKDWAISRERYWGTPLPIWTHESKSEIPNSKFQIPNCNKHLVIRSLEDLNKYAYNKNRFFLARHAESTSNVNGIISSTLEKGKSTPRLTEKGIEQAKKIGEALKKEKIDIIYASPYYRTKETAKIIAKITGAKVLADKRLAEINTGIFNGRPSEEYQAFFKNAPEKFAKTPPGGENLRDVKRRMLEAVRDINGRHSGKNILIVSHGDPLWALDLAVRGLPEREILSVEYIPVGGWKKMPFNNWPFDKDGNQDLHRPFVDEVYLSCPECGGKMRRIKEVADVWFDSGAMPFAQWHYPFENKDLVDKGKQYPADYIAEGIDQTRGWFYTLLAVAVLLGRGLPYRNVISLGLLLDKYGQKMSKSKGNVVDPWEMVKKYGADVLRWYFYTVNPPGEPKRFDENDLRKTFNKLFMLLYNSFVFYSTYGEEKGKPNKTLDEWILARLNQTVESATSFLEKYEVGEAARTIEELVDDLSRWYIRRSRKNVSGKILQTVLLELAKLMAPFTPFFGEALWQSLNYESGIRNHGEEKKPKAIHDSKFIIRNSVHLQDWPKINSKFKAQGSKLLKEMAEIRRLASLALAEREKAGIKVRQPLQKLKIKNLKFKIDKELINLLKDEINVKEVIVDKSIKTDCELDTKITPELRDEGIVRELVRLVQGLRHDAGYQPKNKIVLMMELPKELLEMLNVRGSKLKKAINAKSIVFTKQKFDVELSTKLENQDIWLGVRRA